MVEFCVVKSKIVAKSMLSITFWFIDVAIHQFENLVPLLLVSLRLRYTYYLWLWFIVYSNSVQYFNIDLNFNRSSSSWFEPTICTENYFVHSKRKRLLFLWNDLNIKTNEKNVPYIAINDVNVCHKWLHHFQKLHTFSHIYTFITYRRLEKCILIEHVPNELKLYRFSNMTMIVVNEKMFVKHLLVTR